MRECVTHLKQHLDELRVGRAHTGLLSSIKVAYHGALVPLRQMASVALEDSRTLILRVFDKTTISLVEKAIWTSPLGLNPMTSGLTIRVVIPALTQESRQRLVTYIHQQQEQTKVAIRHVRREGLKQADRWVKEHHMTSDERHSFGLELDAHTQKFVRIVEELIEHKTQQLSC